MAIRVKGKVEHTYCHYIKHKWEHSELTASVKSDSVNRGIGYFIKFGGKR